MSSDFLRKLKGERDLKRILETTVKELGETFACECCQVMLSNPLDPNVTSIYEHKPMKDAELHGLPVTSLPLVLHGRTFGSLNMSRRFEVTPDEITALRVIMGELGDIVRHAQINEIVTRDTFRETFLVEIGNVMAYSLGIGDALFMVVNILGKVLQASRCLFICTDDTQLGWKCYEFWQQERVQSCQEYRWPTTDSAVVAQTLLSSAPLKIYEGQQNSYVSPVQEELQFMGVKSLLGVALRSSEAVHGAVILQQCDYRRAWTRNEIDMVQNVADKVAEALLKLPAEKRAREPIMQLHQRTVALPDADQGNKIQNVRKALKGALGQQAIPTASKTGAPPPPPALKAAPAAPAAKAPVVAPPPAPAAAAQAAPAAPVVAPPKTTATQAQTAASAPAAPGGAPTITPIQSKAAAAAAATPQPAAPAPAQVKSLGNILGAANKGLTPSAEIPAQSVAARALESPEDPYADLDFGEFGEVPESKSEASPAQRRQPPPANDPDTTWANLDALETQPGQALTEPPPPPVQEPAPAAPAAAIEAPSAPAVAAEAPPAPAVSPSNSPWGDLDSIQAPTSAPVRAGLGGMMLGKARASSPGRSPLSASFHKGKGAGEAHPEAPAAAAGAATATATTAVEPIDEAAEKAKLKELVASSATDTSDYIFNTPNLDMRMLGRIDGWVSQIEKKDKYVGGHARQVAEYAQAIAREAGLSEDEVNTVRLAALVHDVGKLGAAAQILQKPDEQLSDPELITVMKHPLDGAELLESFPDLKNLAPIVRAHHEEFDGNGYPQGLKGDEIPVAARIIHVANSYHNLTSPMCYGPGKAPQDAQNELVKGAGKQWDPTFVQALLQAIMTQKVPASF